MGKWAPAETSLIKESSQSNYLVRYFLLMFGFWKGKKVLLASIGRSRVWADKQPVIKLLNEMRTIVSRI